MSGHFTDRDERTWQRRAEERGTRPLPVAAWIARLRGAALRSREAGRRTAPSPAARPRPRPHETVPTAETVRRVGTA